jgi:transposase-like protein
MAGKKNTLPTNLIEAIEYFSDLDVATQFVADLRWPDGPICPNCGGREHSYLSTRRLWKCKNCKRQFSVKVGTIFEDSPIRLNKWLAAIWEVANDKNGISSHELGRKIGVTQKTAWFMTHRIRLAMQMGSFDKYSDKFEGAVEVDETYIGGKARNMHKRRREVIMGGDGSKSKGHAGKTAVVGYLNRGGEVRLHVVEDLKKPAMQKGVRAHVKPGATIITDELKSYRGLDAHYQHEIVNHAETYVDGQIHTNGLENFWSLLKRSLGGTYVSVRPFHLSRYLDEQAYRYNRRAFDDAGRVSDVLGGIEGKRVTWKELTGKESSGAKEPASIQFSKGKRVLPQRPFTPLADL